jgi:hypothetical protein
VIEDDIIREIRATREAFAAAHGYDIRAMVETLRALGESSGREVVDLPPRPALPVEPLPTPHQTGAAPTAAPSVPNLA